MLPPPDVLTSQACPLLQKHGGGADDLVQLFNKAANELLQLKADAELGGLFRTPEFQREIVTALTAVRGEMVRQRYTVGFIGLSQAGKSTSVNNILAEEVCKSGSGVATSSQPARLLRSAGRSLDVIYLRTEDYERRRLKLAQEIGLASPGADAELLEQIKNDSVFAEVYDKPRLKKDREFLAQFIHAANKHRDYLLPEGKIQDRLPYDDRMKYTTHSKEGGPNQTLLLKEAVFHLDLATIPDELEICDLPGLGSERTIDDIVTFEYLPDLNGTLLFVNAAMNLKDVSLTNAINKVRKVFEGDISGRAWIVFTKLDGLTDNYFRPGTDNIFAGVMDILKDQQIPATQVCFVSNELFKEVASEPTENKLAYAAKRMKQTAAKPIPETCPPDLVPAWEALLADGGIGRVRSLITSEVGRSLAGQIRADVIKRLGRFEKDLAHRIAAEKTRVAGGSQLYEKVGTCRAVVMDLARSLVDQPSGFGMLQQAEEFRSRLRGFLDNPETKRVLAAIDPAKLPGEFTMHTRILSQTFKTELSTRIIDPTYAQLAGRLDDLPKVPINGHATCRDAWQTFREEDRAAEAWATELPDFGGREMLDWLTYAAANDDTITGLVYQDMMGEKINAVVHQTMHLLRGRLKDRLNGIVQELELLTNRP